MGLINPYGEVYTLASHAAHIAHRELVYTFAACIICSITYTFAP